MNSGSGRHLAKKDQHISRPKIKERQHEHGGNELRKQAESVGFLLSGHKPRKQRHSGQRERMLDKMKHQIAERKGVVQALVNEPADETAKAQQQEKHEQGKHAKLKQPHSRGPTP